MQALQLIITLMLLVLIHELGHFTFAKIFGARVDKFCLFFDPGFTLFSKKLGETTYALGWLPLGGYCKIAGMIDESLDTDHLESDPQPWEYRSKPLGQRFLIILGGVLFNFISAIIIYSAISYAWGKEYLPLKNLEYGIVCDSTAKEIGLRNCDKILRVDGEEPKTLGDAVTKIVLDNAKTITVERNGSVIDISVPEDLPNRIIASPESFFIAEAVPFFVDSLIAGSPAQQAGLRVDDKIVAIDTIRTETFTDFISHIGNYKGRTVSLTVLRHNYEETLSVAVSEDGKIGVWARPARALFKTETETYTLLESIPEGIRMGVSTMAFYVKQFKLVFTKEGSKQVGTFVSMGKLYDKTWNWRNFWSLAAFFSVILAFMNVLPIPGLDGGHLAFLIYELMTRRKPSPSFLIKAEMIGMAIIFAIFFYALFLDLGRLF